MWVYLNGKFLLAEEAKISPFDRSATFGDGVYEVIPAYAGNLFLFKEHMLRLQLSLKKTFITPPEELDEIENILDALYLKNKHINQYFYIQISRGVQDTRKHKASSSIQSSFFISSQKLEENPYRENPLIEGLKVRLEKDIRWGRCDIKTTALLGNILSMHDPSLEEVDEVIFHKDGFINEGAKSNIFMVKKGLILTPPLDQNILPGITRNHVLNQIRKKGFKVLEDKVSVESLFEADEVWLTSSTKEIQPISVIDNHKLPAISPEESLWKAILDSF